MCKTSYSGDGEDNVYNLGLINFGTYKIGL